ncbi:hypothetical protein [Actinophytocola sp. KF-1]
MDYLCYVSRTKVDALYAELDPEQYSDVAEQIISERSRGGTVHSKIGAVIDGSLTYGRKDTVQLERKVKTAYTAKLRAVLLAIAADHGQIPDVEDLLDGEPVDDGQVYFHADARFGVTDLGPAPTERDVVQLTAELEAARLHLSCSLRHFSEGNGEQYLFHSGNHLFFQGVVKLRLSGVFVLLDRQGDDIYGTPLYLKLSRGPAYGHFAL